MKSRSFAGFLVVAITALVLSGCGWSTSSEGNGDVTYGSIVFNFSGTYTAVNGVPSDRISSFTVQQRDQYITMRDNKGGSYSGHITYASSSSSGNVKTYVYSFQADGTSNRGRPTSVVGTFETFAEAQEWGTSSSNDDSSSKSKSSTSSNDSSSGNNSSDSSSSTIGPSSSSSSSTASSSSTSSSSSDSSSSGDKKSTSATSFTGTTQAKMSASYVEQGGSATTFVGVSYISYTATRSATSSSNSTSSDSSSSSSDKQSSSNNQTSYSSSGGE